MCNEHTESTLSNDSPRRVASPRAFDFIRHGPQAVKDVAKGILQEVGQPLTVANWPRNWKCDALSCQEKIKRAAPGM
jgi:hypothetical protein